MKLLQTNNHTLKVPSFSLSVLPYFIRKINRPAYKLMPKFVFALKGVKYHLTLIGVTALKRSLIQLKPRH